LQKRIFAFPGACDLFWSYLNEFVVTYKHIDQFFPSLIDSMIMMLIGRKAVCLMCVARFEDETDEEFEL
jgi:hypothetical protein